jgi:hypothetical protein
MKTEDTPGGQREPHVALEEATAMISSAVDSFYRLQRVGALFRKLEDDLSGPPDAYDTDARSAVLHGIEALTAGLAEVGERLRDLEYWQMGATERYSDKAKALLRIPSAAA